MANWINVDHTLCQICHWEDATFPFGVYINEYAKMDNHTLPLHWHKMAEYNLVLAGKVELHIDDQLLTLDAGDCVFINSNTLHGGVQLTSSEDAIVCAICFSPELLSENVQNTVYKKYFLPLFGKTICGFKIDRTTAPGNRIHDVLCNLSLQNKDAFGYELSILSQISELWLHTLLYINERDFESEFKIVSPSRSGGIMKSLLVYVQENYAKKISIDLLSSHAHISRSECFVYFKDHTGKTPLEYVNDYRISQAEHLLRTTSLSILDICLSCGFSGQSYFGEMFKKRYGISPAKYRKALLNNSST